VLANQSEIYYLGRRQLGCDKRICWFALCRTLFVPTTAADCVFTANIRMHSG